MGYVQVAMMDASKGIVAAKTQCRILVLIAVKALERLWRIVWGA